MSYQGSSIIQLQYPLFAASPHHVFCHAERSEASASSTKNMVRGFALLSGSLSAIEYISAIAGSDLHHCYWFITIILVLIL
jgi:hypothetical protein